MLELEGVPVIKLTRAEVVDPNPNSDVAVDSID